MFRIAQNDFETFNGEMLDRSVMGNHTRILLATTAVSIIAITALGLLNMMF
jgi:hypothetical protein